MPLPDWLKFAMGTAGIVAVFLVMARLIRKSQSDDPRKRGADSSEPGGFYTDTPD